MDPDPQPTPRRSPRRPALRHLPLVLLIAAGAAVFTLWGDQLAPEALARHLQAAGRWQAAHPLAAPLAFVLVYAGLVGLSLPGAALASLAGGALFGVWLGTALNVMAATLGALAIFGAVRLGIGGQMAERMIQGQGKAARLIEALRRNQWSALLTLRLVPAVPFFLANLLPAFAGIGLGPFALTTMVGIIPGAMVYSALGDGLGQSLRQIGAAPLSAADLAQALPTQLWLALCGLGLLAALPMIVKGIPRAKASDEQG